MEEPRRSLAAADPQRPPVWVLVSFGIVGPTTIHLILPLLPAMQREFGVDYATIQLLISLFVIAFGAAQVFVGPLADLFGRRKMLLGGLVLYMLASMACALAPTVEALVALRMLQAVGACSGIVLARSIIGDHYDERQSTRVLGYLAMGVAIGPMLGPVAGGALAAVVGWRGLFWLLAVVGALNAALAWSFIRRTGRPRAGKGRFRRLGSEIRGLLRMRAFRLYALNICFHTGVFYAFVVGGPFVGTEFLGLSPQAYGAWFATAAVGYTIGNFVAGRLTYLPGLVILVGAILVLAINVALLGVFASGLRSAPAIFLTVAMITLSGGLVMPNSYAGVLKAAPDLAGSASGITGFAQFTSAAIFSSLAGLALETWRDPVALGAVMLFAATLGMVTSAMISADSAR